jgi:YegS/Rv2252/BmrU family lipid kinase
MSDRSDAPNHLRELSPVVFVNCQAGGNRTRRYLPQIQELFKSARLGAEFVITQSTEHLESSARAAINANHRLLLAMGGDGTFQGLVNASFGADVLLGVLPSGGGNDLAAALGWPRDSFKAAEAILRSKARRIDLVRVRTVDGRARLYVGGGGVGLDAEAARYASGPYRQLPSRFRYIASALRALAGFTPLDIRIDFPGSEFPPHQGRALLVAVLNTPSYGAGLRLAPEAALDDGLLNIVMVEDLGKLAVLSLLPRLIGSGELHTSRVKRWISPRVRLTTDRPCLFQGDGEIIGPAPVEIEALPRAIQVLAPAIK